MKFGCEGDRTRIANNKPCGAGAARPELGYSPMENNCSLRSSVDPSEEAAQIQNSLNIASNR
jgi:hypothetical protein